MTRADLREAIAAELRQVDDGINAAYWAFTRTARGRPPACTVPHLYQRRRVLRERLAALARSSPARAPAGRPRAAT